MAVFDTQQSAYRHPVCNISKNINVYDQMATTKLANCFSIQIHKQCFKILGKWDLSLNRGCVYGCDIFVYTTLVFLASALGITDGSFVLLTIYAQISAKLIPVVRASTQSFKDKVFHSNVICQFFVEFIYKTRRYALQLFRYCSYTQSWLNDIEDNLNTLRCDCSSNNDFYTQYDLLIVHLYCLRCRLPYHHAHAVMSVDNSSFSYAVTPSRTLQSAEDSTRDNLSSKPKTRNSYQPTGYSNWLICLICCSVLLSSNVVKAGDETNDLSTGKAYDTLKDFSMETSTVKANVRLSDPGDENNGPWMALPVDQYCEEIKQCPDTPTGTEIRSFCIGHVQNNGIVTYHCQYKTAIYKLLEYMYPRHMCPKGTFGLTEVNELGTQVRVVCPICPAGWFQPEKHASPGNLRGCTYKRRTFDPKRIVCEKGGPSEPDLCYCNNQNGWYSKDNLMTCGFSHPCHCTNEPRCSIDKQDLLPDGRCVSKCAGVRLLITNFDCIIEKRETKTTILLPLSTTDNTKKISKETVIPTEPARGKDLPKVSTSGLSILSIMAIVASVVGGIGGIGVIILLWIKCKGPCIEVHKHNTSIGGDNVTIKHVEEVNYKPVNDSNTSSETEESISNEVM